MDEHSAGRRDDHADIVHVGLTASEDVGVRSAVPAGTRSAFVRQPAIKIAAGLGIAAAGLMATWLSRASSAGRVAKPLVAELAEALGTRRLVEPRLTGGFQYGSVTNLGSGDAHHLDAEPAAVLAAVAQIRERLGGDTSPEALGALGITYLVSGDAAAAVEALESASAQEPENAHLLSDLAAAYLMRAGRLDEPADIPKALESAEKAIALPIPPDEAYFNRALALEALHLVGAARTAWGDYVRQDPASGWADEARKHGENLPKEVHSSVEQGRARVRAALDGGQTTLDTLAHEDPSLLREYFEDVLLPGWADDYLSRHPDANLHRGHAYLVGQALARTTGDAMAQDTARALAEAPRTVSSRNRLRSQALGFRAFHEGKRLYDVGEPSCSHFRDATRSLQVGGSPFGAWARVHSFIACYPRPSQRGAERAELRRLQALAERHTHTQLLGRVHWLQGVLGETSSLERYRSARAYFESTRDRDSQAEMHVYIAELLTTIGEMRGAWRECLRALAFLPRVQQVRTRRSILSEATYAAQQDRAPRAGVHFATAFVETALASSQPVAISDAFLFRAGIYHSLEAPDLAMADVGESRRWITRISDRWRAEWYTAEANAAEGEILARRKPEDAIRPLEDAIGYFRVNVPIRLPPLHLQLARAQLVSGVDTAAEAELLAGIQVMEGYRVSLRDTGLQVPFFDGARPLFDEMVRYQINRRHDPERALSFVERGRSRQLVDSLMAVDTRQTGDDTKAGDGTEAVPLDPVVLGRRLPEGVALIYYVSLDDALFAWTLTRAGIHFVERSLPSTDLSRLAAKHRAALEGRAPVEVVRRTGGLLYDELVRPLLPLLTSARALVLLPDGALQSVAFASLWDRDTERYLVEDYVLALAPSGTIFDRASMAAEKGIGPTARALIVGNPRFDRRLSAGTPDLPEAETEATEIGNLYARSQLLTGGDATKAAFLKGVRDSEVVHFAGHAASAGGNPSKTSLLLAPDARTGDSGILSLNELDQQRCPRTSIVVLAACRTADGNVSRVEGPISLGRLFLAAGVPHVVASLWDIDDAMSRRFQVGFHRRLRLGGDPLQALRGAQIAFLRDQDPAMAHPATWAGFVCMGGLNTHSLPNVGAIRDLGLIQKRLRALHFD